MTLGKGQATNLASEFFVASQLIRLGCTVTITLGHTKEIDLLVERPDGETFTVDVKGLRNKTEWPLQPKRQRQDHFYVLVSYLNKFGDVDVQPEVYIVPSLGVESLLSIWGGEASMRGMSYKRMKEETAYQDAWHLLLE
jgi:hypothetical protein